MKKILIVIIVFLLTGCVDKQNDAMIFKTDYESLNGKTNSSGKVHRTVSIDKDNPFVISSATEIVSKIENKDTFYVYFGSKLCPWCRSVIEKSIEVAKKNNIDTIYYVDIWDLEGNELLRDKYIINDSNELELKDAGTSEYKKLLKYFDEYLREYTLSDSNGNIISTGEKRIYAPNFMYIESGIIKKLTTGKSDKQSDAREVLTLEILKDEEEAFEYFFK